MGFLFLILFVILFGLVLLLPLVMIIAAARNSEHTSNQKVGWIVGMFFLGPIAAALYGIQHIQNRFLKVSSYCTIVCTVLLFLGALAAVPYMKDAAYEQFLATVQNKNLKFDDHSSVEEQKTYQAHIASLNTELQEISIFSMKSAQSSIEMLDLLVFQAKDNLISQPEMAAWSELFAAKATMDPELVKLKVAQLKKAARKDRNIASE